jgi:FlaA1/EpsC-like NDP-sugar epimerase
VNDVEPTLHVGVTGQFNVNTIFYIAEQKYVPMMEENQWNVISKKGNKSTFISV